MVTEYSKEACNSTHRSIDERFNAIHWVAGIVIFLQLSCIGWLGWLSSKVVGAEIGNSVIVERITHFAEKQAETQRSLDKILAKLDAIQPTPAR
jgi:hypothetical protein